MSHEIPQFFELLLVPWMRSIPIAKLSRRHQYLAQTRPGGQARVSLGWGLSSHRLLVVGQESAQPLHFRGARRPAQSLAKGKVDSAGVVQVRTTHEPGRREPRLIHDEFAVEQEQRLRRDRGFL